MKGNKIIMSQIDTIALVDPVTGEQTKSIDAEHPVLLNGFRIYNSDTLKDFPAIKGKNDEKLSAWIVGHLQKELNALDDGKYILAIDNAVIDSKGKLVYYTYNGIKKLNTEMVMVTAADKADPNTSEVPATDIIRKSGIASDTVKQEVVFQAPPPGIVAKDDAANTGESKSFNKEEVSVSEDGINPMLKITINDAVEKLLRAIPDMKPAMLDHKPVACTGQVFSTWNYIIVRDHKTVFTPFYDGL